MIILSKADSDSRVWYSTKYFNPEIEGILVDDDQQPHKMMMFLEYETLRGVAMEEPNLKMDDNTDQLVQDSRRRRII